MWSYGKQKSFEKYGIYIKVFIEKLYMYIFFLKMTLKLNLLIWFSHSKLNYSSFILTMFNLNLVENIQNLSKRLLFPAAGRPESAEQWSMN
jgi:hypothetical protein